MTKHLPVPNKGPFPDWSRFLTAVWRHGRSRGVMSRALAEKHAFRATEPLIEAFTRSDSDARVRPSSFVTCAQQTYFMTQGMQPEPMPAEIPMTFAVGHFLHEVSFAAIAAGLPPGFEAEFEREVELPDWWPKDHLMYNTQGHIDIILRVTDWALAEDYIDPDIPEEIIVDLKTMGGYSWREHRKKVFEHEADGFGYLTQLAIYADATGLIEGGAILAGINRDLLMQPLAPRHITSELLYRELGRVKVAIEGAVKGIPAGPEFIERWNGDASFFCGTQGKKGYCGFKKQCAEWRRENGCN